MARPFLLAIESTFAPALAEYGFKPGYPKDNDYVDSVTYVNAERSVRVLYSHTREQRCEVSISGYGDPEPFDDLMRFVGGLTQDAHYNSTNDSHLFKKEAERCCGLLIEYCKEFLCGDIPAFRERYRELFLVAQVRNARYNAVAQHKWDDFERYHKWLADYWSETDHKDAAFGRSVRERWG